MEKNWKSAHIENDLLSIGTGVHYYIYDIEVKSEVMMVGPGMVYSIYSRYTLFK